MQVLVEDLEEDAGGGLTPGVADLAEEGVQAVREVAGELQGEDAPGE